MEAVCHGLQRLSLQVMQKYTCLKMFHLWPHTNFNKYSNLSSINLGGFSSETIAKIAALTRPGVLICAGNEELCREIPLQIYDLTLLSSQYASDLNNCVNLQSLTLSSALPPNFNFSLPHLQELNIHILYDTLTFTSILQSCPSITSLYLHQAIPIGASLVHQTNLQRLSIYNDQLQDWFLLSCYRSKLRKLALDIPIASPNTVIGLLKSSPCLRKLTLSPACVSSVGSFLVCDNTPLFPSSLSKVVIGE